MEELKRGDLLSVDPEYFHYPVFRRGEKNPGWIQLDRSCGKTRCWSERPSFILADHAVYPDADDGQLVIGGKGPWGN